MEENASVWSKVHLDFKNIDGEGLTGPPTGKVAVHYEFCIPREDQLWTKVKKMDPTAEKSLSRGRVGCSETQWLVIGNTHQKNYKRVLYDLASLPEVERIQQTFFE